MTVRLSVRPPSTCHIYYHCTDSVKELERKIQRKKKKKGDEVHWKKKHETVQSYGEKTRNASGQQGKNERQRKKDCNVGSAKQWQ